MRDRHRSHERLGAAKRPVTDDLASLDVFERFTNRARRVLVLAQEEHCLGAAQATGKGSQQRHPKVRDSRRCAGDEDSAFRRAGRHGPRPGLSLRTTARSAHPPACRPGRPEAGRRGACPTRCPALRPGRDRSRVRDELVGRRSRGTLLGRPGPDRSPGAAPCGPHTQTSSVRVQRAVTALLAHGRTRGKNVVR